MMKSNLKCNRAVLSKFIDGELTPEERSSILAHLDECNACTGWVNTYRELSDTVKTDIEKELVSVESELIRVEEAIFDQINDSGTSWWSRIKNLSLSMKFLVPATAIATLLFAFITISKMNAPKPSTGPSAIVSSFSGDTSSVMIFETPNKHHTVIWFKEAS